jgi:hypothetical protein
MDLLCLVELVEQADRLDDHVVDTVHVELDLQYVTHAHVRCGHQQHKPLMHSSAAVTLFIA